MRGRVFIAWIVIAATAAAAQEPERPSGVDLARQLESAFTEVDERVSSSVVGITVFLKDPAGEKAPDESGGWREAERDPRYPGYRKLRSGSGVLVSKDGYILSCHHVLIDAELIDVEFAGDVHWRGRVIGTEPTINLAVLKVDVPLDFPPATLGDSEAVRVGHWAIALGDPDGPERTFSAGTVSAKPERDCYQEQLTRTYLQSSVRIPPESYGGPLVDIDGRVIGINTPRYDSNAGALDPSPGGSVYALPINLVQTIYEALKEKESKRSPWLGISVLHLSPDIRRRLGSSPPTGIYIDDVFDPSPASQADIRVGDILVQMDGNRVLSVQGFQRWLYLLGIGKTITVEVFRGGELLERTVTIEQRPASATTS